MEALALVLVAAVTVIIFVVTWVGVRNDAGRYPIAGRDQLEAYRDALQKKALRAQQERWDDAMVARVTDELDEVEQRLARLEKRAA
jgi:hypothetical protein